MIKINITEEVEDAEALVDLLNQVATMVKDGYTSGVYPHWDIETIGEEE